jgi:hypothetical protein
MKAIALDQTDNRIAEALKQQQPEEPIILTEGTDAIGLLLKFPEGLKDSGIEAAYWLEGPAGLALVLIQAKNALGSGSGSEPGRPVFGSCQGMLTTVSEDDEHLKDFEEYMT